jgi:hypothetical protein
MSIDTSRTGSAPVMPRDDTAASRLVAPRTTAVVVIGLLFSGLVLLAVAPFALPDSYSYSWVEQGTSESAAQGIVGGWVARLGFVTLGLAVIWLASLRARAWRLPGTVLHLAFGIGLICGAVYSTKP